MSDGTVIIDTKLDESGIKKGLSKLKGDISSSLSGIGKSLTTGFKTSAAIIGTVGTAVAGVGYKCTDLASDLVEVQNVVDTTFGDSAKIINKWAIDANKAYGLNETQANKYVSTLGAMMKASDITGDSLNKMSMDLAGLSADFASFFNLANDEAFDKIKAGIAGETEPLRSLGINMSVANLEAFALSKGINKAYEEMTEAEKVTLRYNYLMEKGKDAAGDFAKTSGESLANQLRITKNSVVGLGTSIGNDLLPQMLDCTKGVNNMIADMRESFETGGIDALVKNLGETIADVAVTIADKAPTFINIGIDILSNLCKGLEKNTDKIANSAIKIVKALGKGFIKLSSNLYDLGAKLMSSIAKGLFGSSVAKDLQVAANKLKKIFVDVFKVISNVSKTVLPPVAKVFSTLAKHLDIIIPLLTAGYTAFKLWKIASTVQTWLSGLNISMTTLTSSVKGLSLAIAANPLGMLITVVGAAITGVAALSMATEDAAEKMDKSAEETRKNAEAYKEFKDSLEESQNAALAEINNVEKLKEELKGLADENGVVNDANKERASFILGELNKALGTEYTMTGNQIDQYKELCGSIDDLIAKKKASIILESQESAYQNALTQKDEAIKKLGKSTEEYNKDIRDGNKAQEEYDNYVKNTDMSYYNEAEADRLWQNVETRKNAINKKKEIMDQDVAQLQQYNDDIAMYETNAMLAAQGRYDEMITGTNEFITAKEISAEKIKSITEQELKDLENYFLGAKTAFEKGSITEEDFNTIANNLQKACDQFYGVGKKVVDKTTGGVRDNKGNVEKAAKDTIDGAKKSADSQTDSFKDTGRKAMENTGQGVDSNYSRLKNSINSAVNNAKNGVNTSSFSSIGANIVAGVSAGVESNRGSLFGSLRNLANGALAAAKAALGIHSPSRVFKEKIGRWIPLGIGEGIKDTMPDLKETLTNLLDETTNADVYNLDKKLNAAVNRNIAVTTESVITSNNNQSVNVNNNIGGTIETPVYLNGREIARGIAPYQYEFINYNEGRK